MKSASNISTSLSLHQRYSICCTYWLVCLTLPTSARDTRYPSAIRIQEQPRIHFPRFSWIWDGRREATPGSSVVPGEESKVHWSRRSAACHLVSLYTSIHVVTDARFSAERFCFVLNKSRPLLPLEIAFFETARAGKGIYLRCHRTSSRLTLYSTRYCNLHQVRWSYDSDLRHGSGWRWKSPNCGGRSGKEVQKAIERVCLPPACRCLLRRQVLVNLAPKCRLESSTFKPCVALHIRQHQDQVKVLIEKTASSLDDTALEMLFVSVQQNNIELCIRYAIDQYVMFSNRWGDLTLTLFSLTTECGDMDTVCCRHPDPNDCVRLNSIQKKMARRTMLWFGHSLVSEGSISWAGTAGYSLFTE